MNITPTLLLLNLTSLHHNNNINILLNNSVTQYGEEFTTSLYIKLIFYFLYSLIFILGVFGNILVCYVVARNQDMQTVTNLFITNLAVSDILLCMLAVPLTPLYTFLGGWVFGESLCHLLPYAQGVSIYISTLTLTSIAIDRYLVIIYPFRPRMQVMTCKGIIVIIWIVALVLTLPYGIYMGLEKYQYCEENWPTDNFRLLFSSITCIFQFVIPFFLIAFCYICVSIKLNDRAKSKPGCKTSKREEADRERKKRTNRMLIAMVTIFGVCWMPLNINNILDDIYDFSSHWSYYYLCFFMVLPCISRFSTTNFMSGTTEPYRSERLCNGNDAIQENLLNSLASKFNPNVTEESIQLESRPASPFQPNERIINEFTDVEDT
ncbi:Similar to RYa-R: RYamide receptor (Drosophila melanogaster) [Cotesia congregata]|uniref:Similar to RYa-R: RYamide receptor (Drosophila melanogaster) n=1 Tax=Cotesia congregata TaxID=51543 RepID=A0A8J2MPK6_COTCN|nr:Similar to RYa-R: RYamide receptor (Drosophila melanogaster) [Cotesia congregata]